MMPQGVRLGDLLLVLVLEIEVVGEIKETLEETA